MPDNVDGLAESLVRLLKDQVGLQSELAMHMRHKLDAIKQADSERIESITARESLLLKRAAEREGLRRQLTEKVIAGLGLDPAQKRTLRLTELAEHFPEPRRSQLLGVAIGLKERLEETEGLRDTTMLVTQEMLKHLREVFTVMTTGGREPSLYSRDGRRDDRGPANVFEAVG